MDLKLDEKYGCETIAVLHWEQLHSILLPDEVKNFYLATNGFEFTWKFRLAGKKRCCYVTECALGFSFRP